MSEHTRWQYWIWNPDAHWDSVEGAYIIQNVGKFTSVSEALDQLGDLGWELIAVTDRPVAMSGPAVVYGARHLYLKRPRSE